MIWILFALLSAISAALVSIFGKIGLAKIDSTLATAIRSLIMALILVVTCFALGKNKLINTVDSNALKFIVYSGIAGAISWIFYFLALKNGPASGVVAIDRLSIIFVVILAVLFLNETLTTKSIIGVVLIIAGSIFLVLK